MESSFLSDFFPCCLSARSAFLTFLVGEDFLAIVGGVAGFWGGVFAAGALFVLMAAVRMRRKLREERERNPDGRERIITEDPPEEGRQLQEQVVEATAAVDDDAEKVRPGRHKKEEEKIEMDVTTKKTQLQKKNDTKT